MSENKVKTGVKLIKTTQKHVNWQEIDAEIQKGNGVKMFSIHNGRNGG